LELKASGCSNQLMDLEKEKQEMNIKLEECIYAKLQAEKQIKEISDSKHQELNLLRQTNLELQTAFSIAEIRQKEAKDLLETKTRDEEQRISLDATNKEIYSLRSALQFLKKENAKLKAKESINKLTELPPLKLKHKTQPLMASQDFIQCQKQLLALLESISKVLAFPQIVDLSKGTPPKQQYSLQNQQLMRLLKEGNKTKNQLEAILLKNNPGLRSSSKFTIFPIPNLSKILSNKELIPIGKISMHKQCNWSDLPNPSPKVVLNSAQLTDMHSVLF